MTYCYIYKKVYMNYILTKFLEKTPQIGNNVFIAPGSVIIGDVKIGDNTNIWYNTIIRGDVESIEIGANTNIQDGAVIHVTRGGGKTFIGSNVTIGHKALLHACTIEDDSFIGMGAIMLDNSLVESGAMLAAGALLAPGKRVKKGEIWAGNPAKFMRMMTEKEIDYIAISADNYTKLASIYLDAK